jgi:hypothetical protein
MSNDEADKLMDTFEKWDAKQARSSFVHRMERKLARKERRN